MEQHSREQRLLDLLVGNPTLKAGIKGGVMNMEAAVSEKGQVTIPKPIREQLGLRPGGAVEFSAVEGRLVGMKVASSRFGAGCHRDYQTP